MQPQETGQPIKIITYVLDDDYDELLLLKAPLQQVCGADLELFTDPEEFLHAIACGVHICIIDHQLTAKVDGIEVGKRVLQKNDQAFLILFSGSSQDHVWLRALNSGFKGGVNKNHADAYQQVADLVAVRMPEIRERIRLQEKYRNIHA